ncbi:MULTISPECIES: hypothetical protein [Novosphingobium]|uniref:Uncharacterized protein n=1 Tax=Novosphingobium mathurense TaxID=428990 RepID=A0A1U6HFC0_9SPHN|nr:MULTISPECIES: hypothetical protein [Novosphingobium]CDO36872.1 conserved exported hypothetical protein [Novosphingobium sp. KN65.2]SLJ94473.1 hypothetical protein SAMN06295987_102301 [Novosphingobium mathurense]
MRSLVPLMAVLALAGCGKGDNDPGPGGVTVGEARALDQAAEMLDERRPPAAAPESSDAPSEAATYEVAE